jgi:trimeric autotransporter adhesin
MFGMKWARPSWARQRPLLAVILLSSVAACGGDGRAKPPTDPVPVPVARVTVTASLGLAFVGLNEQLTAATFDASGNVLTDRAVSWSSSDTSKLTVSSTGLVTGVAEGNVTVTATSEGQSGSAELLVFRIDVDSVDVTPTTATVHPGATQRLTAQTLSRTGLPFPGRTVTWSSSDTSKATVDPSGLVAAVATGSVTITATCEGKSGRAVITIVP